MSAVLLVWALATTNAQAGHGHRGCHLHCPRCNHVCKLHVEQEKETRTCFNVECEPICIPPVTFPWEKCCPIKPARVKYISVLKAEEYECDVCRYNWTPEEVPACGCPCGVGPWDPTLSPRAATSQAGDYIRPATGVEELQQAGHEPLGTTRKSVRDFFPFWQQ